MTCLVRLAWPAARDRREVDAEAHCCDRMRAVVRTVRTTTIVQTRSARVNPKCVFKRQAARTAYTSNSQAPTL